MREQNPARSGDTRDICWMVASRKEFYHETYRSPKGQISIIEHALRLHGDKLRRAAELPTKKWHRNVKTYCGNSTTIIDYISREMREIESSFFIVF